MKNLCLLLLLIFIVSCEDSKKHVPVTSGVSSELASFRKQQLADVTYALSFSIPENIEEEIAAQLKLSLSINDPSEPLQLDFKSNKEIPEQAVVNGKTISIEFKNEHLIIPSEHLLNGRNTIEIAFIAGEQSLNRKKDFLFTLLVPDRARTLFPCFDQPDIKATYVLNISAPKNWEVVTAAPVVQKIENGPFTDWQFGASDKMSTYLFSFVAGEFSKITSEETARPMNLLHQEKDSAKIASSTAEIFRLHQESLNELEEYTQFDFPFQKFDYAAIYSHPYGGMEHTGAIQYKQQSLFLDKSATRSQELRRAKLIAHESAHMWFGNLVTMQWFDDVWLKEVFANFMADKIAQPNFKDIDHELSFFVGHYPAAYSVDRTRGANPIRQDLDNLENAGSLYGDIIYHKAPVMMRQLEAIVGKNNFRQGIAEYIKTYANDNAVWNDLIEILDKKSPQDLRTWSEVWVNSPGRPIIHTEFEIDDQQKIGAFSIHQEAEDGSNKLWPQQFEIALIYEDSTHVLPVVLNERNIEIQGAIGLSKPDNIVVNSNGYGYGLFLQSSTSYKQSSRIKNDVSRASAFLNGFENTLNGTIRLEDAIFNIHAAMRSEENELILNLLSNQLTHLYWNYLTAPQRENFQPLTQRLFEELYEDTSSNIKKSIFRTFRSMAHTGEAREQLYKIWNKEIQIPGLLLNKDDYTSIAMDLALYGHEKSQLILEEARATLFDENSKALDQKKVDRFDFLLPALSGDAKTRNEYFSSFTAEDMRAEESWVLYACKYIHHPLRQETAIDYLDISLDLLEEIQRTGDIFFPKQWLDQTIGQYTSEQAMAVLQAYLDAKPDLNPKLRLKVLQATDDLYMVQKVLKNSK